jgi:hypothetical protein
MVSLYIYLLSLETCISMHEVETNHLSSTADPGSHSGNQFTNSVVVEFWFLVGVCT